MNYNNILSPGDRSKLITYLSTEATDEILLRAAADVKEHKLYVQREYESVRKFAGLLSPKTSSTPSSSGSTEPAPSTGESSAKATTESGATSTAKKNVEPPGTATSRIGSDTKAAVARHLAKGPDGIEGLSVAMGRAPAQAKDLLKRLWAIKEIGYDGKQYYAL